MFGPELMGAPRYAEAQGIPEGVPNKHQSGIALSDDLRHWDVLGLITPPTMHDRDNVLFPERIGGRYAMLRRPESHVGPAYGCDRPSIWLSWSDDLRTWTEPELVAAPRAAWEARKIGAASPPLRTPDGWLTLYHGVDGQGVYRVGAMLLDAANPARVLARTRHFIMEPEAYCEKVGFIIPNVVFPSANAVKDGLVYIHYGCCDTCIGAATVPLKALVRLAREGQVRPCGGSGA